MIANYAIEIEQNVYLDKWVQNAMKDEFSKENALKRRAQRPKHHGGVEMPWKISAVIKISWKTRAANANWHKTCAMSKTCKNKASAGKMTWKLVSWENTISKSNQWAMCSKLWKTIALGKIPRKKARAASHDKLLLQANLNTKRSESREKQA